MMGGLSRAQRAALDTLRNHGGWMLLPEIGVQWRTIDALVKRGLVLRNRVAGLSEYKIIDPP
jgi:hypothetical protein